MRKFLLLFIVLTSTGIAQTKELNKLFFDIPLHHSRDSIYDFLLNADFITKEKNKGKVTKNGVAIKIFSGFHNKVETVDTKADSIQFQLSTGSISFEEEKGYKNILVFYLDYLMDNKKDAEIKFKQLQKEIDAILQLESWGGPITNEKKKKIGLMQRWSYEKGLSFELDYEVKEEKHWVRLTYNRYE